MFLPKNFVNHKKEKLEFKLPAELEGEWALFAAMFSSDYVLALIWEELKFIIGEITLGSGQEHAFGN